jgi:hypothetical protein
MKATAMTTRAATDRIQAVGHSQDERTFNSERCRPSVSDWDGVVECDRAGDWRPRT